MNWLNTIGELAERYAGNANQPSRENTHEDFQQVVEAAPQHVVANGIAHMFRSDQTPAFADMVSNLFGQSNPNQRAGLLNELLSSVEPGALATLPGLGNLAGLFGGSGKNMGTLATQISPEQVQQLGTHVQNQDPSVIDR